MSSESHPVIIPQHVAVPVRYWQIPQEVCFTSAFIASIFVFIVKCSF